MSARTPSASLLLTLASAVALAMPAAAADPVLDSMRPNTGPTATAPRPAEREMRRDFEKKTPTLTERFGLPPLSGPLPPFVAPPPRHHPVLLDRGRGALPPPPPPRLPQRARHPRDRDG